MGVIFKTDPYLVELGYRGPDAYARDKNGNFILEAVGRPNPKMIRFFLEMVRPEKWGKQRKIDGRRPIFGPLSETVDVKYATPTRSASVQARQWKSWSKKIRDATD
jgi:hypothetical protein